MGRKAAVKTKPAPPPSMGIYDSLFDNVAVMSPTQAKGFSDAPWNNRYRLSSYEVEQAMVWNGVMENFICRPAEDSLANDVKWTVMKDSQQKQVNNWLEDHAFYEACEEADIAKRRTGFAAIWIDTGALANRKPMRPGELKRFKEFVVFDADQLHADSSQYAVGRQPKIWTITDGTREVPPEIHESRLLIFPGKSPSRRARWLNGGKGESDAARVWLAFLKWLKVNDCSEHIAQTYEEPVIYMEGLNKKLATGGGKEIKAKATDFALTRDALRLAVLDASEKYERPGPPLTGLEVIFDKSDAFFLNQTGFPRSILFSNLEGGSLGGDGASKGEEQEWAKYIARYQKRWFRAVFRKFFKLLKDAFFKRFDFSFEFPPLHQQSEVEWEGIATSQNNRLVAAKGGGLLNREETRQIGKDIGLYPNIDPKAPPDEPEAASGDGEDDPGKKPDEKPDPGDPEDDDV